MLLTLADVFRCPADHEETSLVLSVEAWRGQRVDRGLLGCPFCHARYPITDGVIDFRADRSTVPTSAPEPAPPEEAERVQALLNLSEPGGVILLAGRYAAVATTLAEHVDTLCLVEGFHGREETCVGVLLGERVPVATGALRAAGGEDGLRTTHFLSELARTVQADGRVLWTGALPPPDNVELLAQGDGEWVGRVKEAPAVISLQRLRRRQGGD